MRVLRLVIGLLLLATALHSQEEPEPTGPPERWLEAGASSRPSVPGYLEEMTWKAIPKGIVVLAGSRTAWQWDVQKWFSDYRAVNRGFGGARIDDTTFFAGDLILPFEPSTIILSAGDADLRAGATSQEVVLRFQTFVERVRQSLPTTQIVFVSIVPEFVAPAPPDRVHEANRGISEWTAKHPDLWFVDPTAARVDSRGESRRDLFSEDGRGLSERGYLEWTLAIKPTLRAAERRFRQVSP